MTYLIKFPIGDWSGDGHEECKWFTVSSNRPVEEVREAHFKCKDVFGFTPGEICRDYEERELKSWHLISLSKNGIQVELDEWGMTPKRMLQLWVWMLEVAEPGLILEVQRERDAPSINFYGFDSRNRHLDTPGYGLFE